MSASAAGAPVAPAAAARLPRQVKLFGAVSLLNDFASEMIYPLLPHARSSCSAPSACSTTSRAR